jgi:hypothetical protein
MESGLARETVRTLGERIKKMNVTWLEIEDFNALNFTIISLKRVNNNVKLMNTPCFIHTCDKFGCERPSSEYESDEAILKPPVVIILPNCYVLEGLFTTVTYKRVFCRRDNNESIVCTCGDGVCGEGENLTNCKEDCRIGVFGDFCKYNESCKSQYCMNNICCDRGICCKNNTFCGSNSVCDNRTFSCKYVNFAKGIQDYTCKDDFDCFSRNCKNGICCEQGEECCINDYQCPIKSVCVGYTCKKVNGMECTKSKECQSGNCNEVCCKAGHTCCKSSAACGFLENCDPEQHYCVSKVSWVAKSIKFPVILIGVLICVTIFLIKTKKKS